MSIHQRDLWWNWKTNITIINIIELITHECYRGVKYVGETHTLKQVQLCFNNVHWYKFSNRIISVKKKWNRWSGLCQVHSYKSKSCCRKCIQKILRQSHARTSWLPNFFLRSKILPRIGCLYVYHLRLHKKRCVVG